MSTERVVPLRNALRRALKSTLPVLTGYLVLGFGFGVIMRAEGFGALVAVAMSVFIYAGSMQYAAVGLMTGGASLIAIGFTTLMVNARHVFYGVSMLDKYKKMGAVKPYLIFGLTDESYSLVCSADPSHPDYKKYSIFVTALDHLYWIGGTALGASLGAVMPFSTEGIDFALTALFLTVFIEQWLSAKRYFSALLGVGASVLALVIFGADRFLIPAMLIIALVLAIKRDGGEEAERNE